MTYYQSVKKFREVYKTWEFKKTKVQRKVHPEAKLMESVENASNLTNGLLVSGWVVEKQPNAYIIYQHYWNVTKQGSHYDITPIHEMKDRQYYYDSTIYDYTKHVYPTGYPSFAVVEDGLFVLPTGTMPLGGEVILEDFYPFIPDSHNMQFTAEILRTHGGL